MNFTLLLVALLVVSLEIQSEVFLLLVSSSSLPCSHFDVTVLSLNCNGVAKGQHLRS